MSDLSPEIFNCFKGSIRFKISSPVFVISADDRRQKLLLARKELTSSSMSDLPPKIFNSIKGSDKLEISSPLFGFVIPADDKSPLARKELTLTGSQCLTYPQKSSTVSKAVTSLRLAVHSLALSFLKNHIAHLFCSGCLINSSGEITGISSVCCTS